MRIFRIGSVIHPLWDSAGAALVGGRWNPAHPDTARIVCSETRNAIWDRRFSRGTAEMGEGQMGNLGSTNLATALIALALWGATLDLTLGMGGLMLLGGLSALTVIDRI